MEKKEIFEVVKYFKSIYTPLKIENEFYVKDLKIFYKKNPFFLMYGELLFQESNPFLEWAKGKEFMISVEDMNSLRTCLKKNVQEIEMTDDYFKLTYTDKEENPMEFLCTMQKDDHYEDIIISIDKIQNVLSKEFDLTDDYLEDDLLELYLDNEDITLNRTDIKLIEFPIKRILAYQKDSTHKIRISDLIEGERRYIEVSSTNDLFKLKQIFATI